MSLEILAILVIISGILWLFGQGEKVLGLWIILIFMVVGFSIIYWIIYEIHTFAVNYIGVQW